MQCNATKNQKFSHILVPVAQGLQALQALSLCSPKAIRTYSGGSGAFARAFPAFAFLACLLACSPAQRPDFHRKENNEVKNRDESWPLWEKGRASQPAALSGYIHHHVFFVFFVFLVFFVFVFLDDPLLAIAIEAAIVVALSIASEAPRPSGE